MREGAAVCEEVRWGLDGSWQWSRESLDAWMAHGGVEGLEMPWRPPERWWQPWRRIQPLQGGGRLWLREMMKGIRFRIRLSLELGDKMIYIGWVIGFEIMGY